MNTLQKPFRSRQERDSEVDLVQKYRGIGIAAVAAAGAGKDQLPQQRPQAYSVEALD